LNIARSKFESAKSRFDAITTEGVRQALDPNRHGA
jgi:hypothetical protein